jgi:hypothetical protein
VLSSLVCPNKSWKQSSQRQVEDQRLALSIAAPRQGSENRYFPTYRKSLC